MTTKQQHAVDFLGYQITSVCDDDGTAYVPLKRLCEILGIDHKWQMKKSKTEEIFNGKVISVPGTDGIGRRMFCLPLEAIGAWVATIDADTVRPGALEALGDFQEQSEGALEDSDTEEDSNMREERKEQAYNCLGNSSWFLDAFLIWVEEMIKYGEYFPGDDVRKASREEVQEFVRRTRCNVRVMQAIVDAGRRYEELDDGINEEGLTELHKEVWALYESIEVLIQELCDDHFNLVATDHPALAYLSSSAFGALSHACPQIEWDFHRTIIPPVEG